MVMYGKFTDQLVAPLGGGLSVTYSGKLMSSEAIKYEAITYKVLFGGLSSL